MIVKGHFTRLLRQSLPGMALLLTAAMFAACVALTPPVPPAGADPRVVEYDGARLPGLLCVQGRVIAETDPRLSTAQRSELWRRYGLRPCFEWLVPQDGFTYHELAVRQWNIIDRALAGLTGRALPSRELPELIAQLNEDRRVHWAAPDALVLVWDYVPVGRASCLPNISTGWKPAPPVGRASCLPALAAGWKPALPEQAQHGFASTAAMQDEAAAPTDIRPDEASGLTDGAYGVTLIDDKERTFSGGLEEWAKQPGWPEPLPDFEYYRLCDPDGTAVPWAPELAGNPAFMQRCATLHGTGQARALAAYQAAGSPPLAPITVCVADTGVYVNHPDLAGRLHPNAIDLNYSNYIIAAPGDRPDGALEIKDRGMLQATGLPRPAIKGQPAAHGTCTAGLVARCTGDFASPQSQVRLLPASLKSDRTFAIVGTRIKSPISAFIKLVACLYHNYPVGSFTPDPGAAVQNTGDVRVVTTSASVPRTYFTDAQWNVVSTLINKGAAAVQEDLHHNDRTYLFASGNEAQAGPNKPGDEDFVIAVSATMAFDAAKPWYYPLDGEGANMGLKCVSAPGHGIITSLIYACPNLAYLPEKEVPQPSDNLALPHREMRWEQQTNRFCATSSATPQVAALAALLYAQDPQRTYVDVIQRIEESTAGRMVEGKWGKTRGLVDYAAALGW
jgi:hypothetical protein